MNGPFKASKHDVTIFRSDVLMDMIPPGHRMIADNGYRGEAVVVSAPSSYDPKVLRKFKSRARARQESFNGHIQNFKCIYEIFRHGKDKHKIAFEAVCVIIQYQMEFGSPLFDV